MVYVWVYTCLCVWGGWGGRGIGQIVNVPTRRDHVDKRISRTHLDLYTGRGGTRTAIISNQDVIDFSLSPRRSLCFSCFPTSTWLSSQQDTAAVSETVIHHYLSISCALWSPASENETHTDVFCSHRLSNHDLLLVCSHNNDTQIQTGGHRSVSVALKCLLCHFVFLFISEANR